jgi:hypothetical protein
MKSIFSISDEDVQCVAIRKLGRRLTDDEIEQVQDGVEWGLVYWEEVVGYAINDLQK